MLSTLKFVQGAVGRKDLVPALTHFRIAGGRIFGYNGKMALSAPVALDVDCVPKAIPLVKAIEACDETAQLHLTPTGKLAIRSGKFRAHVDTLPEEAFPDVRPEGQFVQLTGPLLPAMRALYELSGEDATRPWAAGVLLDGESAYATNNVILAEFWLGCHFPYRVNVPRYAVKEMLRINEEPVSIQLTANNITFHYDGERWLRSQLNSNEWPNAREMLDVRSRGVEVPPVPEGLFAALDTLQPFTDDLDRIYMIGGDLGRLATAPVEGMSVDIPEPLPDGIYNHEMISLLDGLATHIGFGNYPNPAPWYGDRVRGLLMGMRQ